MSKEKQIDIDIAVEEMASTIREITVKCGKCEYYKDGSCLNPVNVGCDINEDILNECDAIYNAGYRKQSGVAREIFDEIERTFKGLLNGDIGDILKLLSTMKKKYTEQK